MKKFRKLLALVMAVCMVCMVGTVAMAADEKVILPRAPYCDVCGTVMSTFMQWTDWSRTGDERDCTHYIWGSDLKEEHTQIITYTCPNCGYGYDQDGSTQSRWICYGFN